MAQVQKVGAKMSRKRSKKVTKIGTDIWGQKTITTQWVPIPPKPTLFGVIIIILIIVFCLSKGCG